MTISFIFILDFKNHSCEKSTIGKLTFLLCLLAFWRKNNKNTFGALFLVAILTFCQSRLLVSQHVAEDCAVLAYSAVSLCFSADLFVS